MRKNCKAVLFLTLISCCILSDAEAIGGRGGGRGGGGARGGGREHSQGRSQIQSRQTQASRANLQKRGEYNVPSFSMNRAEGRQNIGQRNASRPNQQQLQQFLQQHQGTAKAQNTRSALSQQSYKNSLVQRSKVNANTAAQTTSRFRQQHPNAHNWFNRDFFDRHHYHPNYYHPYANWWGTAGWATTAAWIGLSPLEGGYPGYYYDDSGLYTDLSPEEAYTYSPVQQYIYNAPVESQTYYQTEAPVAVQTQEIQNQGDWLPLGVFAVGSSASQAAYSNMFIQLALNKQGFISGTYYNAATDQAHEIEGMVDKDTQKAVWKLSDNADSPVANTGLYNLTQNVVDIQVYFPNGSDQKRVLVRLDNPASNS